MNVVPLIKFEAGSSDDNKIINSNYQIKPSENYLHILKITFGHSNFRDMQWNVIRSIIEDKRDNCVVMSTGYGKSLCYQYPAVFLNGLTIVVSPLISLMQDQVMSLNVSNIPACLLGSAQVDKSITKNIINDEYKIVYVTPEYITSESGRILLEALNSKITLIGIDEAHCLSQWGHDFRPSFRALKIIREIIPHVPILAVTATATSRVRDDIIKCLELRNPQVLCTSFDRANLKFYVYPRGMLGVWNDLQKYLNSEIKGSKIVYCLTRKLTDQVATIVRENGINCEAYHAGLPIKQRTEVHEKFVKDQIQVIIATIAFGMGIDKPDVRYVIHYGASKDIESYYQEVGRAGRDGLPSKCIMFYNQSDFAIHEYFRKDITDLLAVHLRSLASKMHEYVELMDCRRLFILRYFEGYNVKLAINDICCDNCDRNRSGIVVKQICDGMDSEGLVDFSLETKYLLQAIQVFNGNTGLTIPIQLLRGSSNKKLSKLTKHKLFGIARNKSEIWWKSLGILLEKEGFIKFTNVVLPTFTYKKVGVSQKGFVWLCKTEPIKLKPLLAMCKISIDNKFKNDSSNFEDTKIKSNTSSEVDYTEVLMTKLLKTRHEIASQLDIMPYMIASNTALREMSQIKPLDLDEMKLSKIDAFSNAKIDKFGPTFLKTICEIQTLIDEEEDKKIEMFEAIILNPISGAFYSADTSSTYDLWNDGKSIQEIAFIKNVTEEKVVDYLCENIKSGMKFTKQDLQKCGIDDYVFNIIISNLQNIDLQDISLDYLKVKCPPDFTLTNIKLVLSYQQVRNHLKNLKIPFKDYDKIKIIHCKNNKYKTCTQHDNKKTESIAYKMDANLCSKLLSVKSETEIPNINNKFTSTSTSTAIKKGYDEIEFSKLLSVKSEIPNENNNVTSTSTAIKKEYDDNIWSDEEYINFSEIDEIIEIANKASQEEDKKKMNNNLVVKKENNNIFPPIDTGYLKEENNELTDFEIEEITELENKILNEIEMSNEYDKNIETSIPKVSSTTSIFDNQNQKLKSPIIQNFSKKSLINRIVPTKKIIYTNSSSDEDVESVTPTKRALPFWLCQNMSANIDIKKKKRRRKHLF